MAQALGQKDVTAGDRAALAELLRLEAETSAIETRIAENVIADGPPEAPPDDLSRWEKVRASGGPTSKAMRKPAIGSRARASLRQD